MEKAVTIESKIILEKSLKNLCDCRKKYFWKIQMKRDKTSYPCRSKFIYRQSHARNLKVSAKNKKR